MQQPAVGVAHLEARPLAARLVPPADRPARTVVGERRAHRDLPRSGGDAGPLREDAAGLDQHARAPAGADDERGAVAGQRQRVGHERSVSLWSTAPFASSTQSSAPATTAKREPSSLAASSRSGRPWPRRRRARLRSPDRARRSRPRPRPRRPRSSAARRASPPAARRRCRPPDVDAPGELRGAAEAGDAGHARHALARRRARRAGSGRRAHRPGPRGRAHRPQGSGQALVPVSALAGEVGAARARGPAGEPSEPAPTRARRRPRTPRCVGIQGAEAPAASTQRTWGAKGSMVPGTWGARRPGPRRGEPGEASARASGIGQAPAKPPHEGGRGERGSPPEEMYPAGRARVAAGGPGSTAHGRFTNLARLSPSHPRTPGRATRSASGSRGGSRGGGAARSAPTVKQTTLHDSHRALGAQAWSSSAAGTCPCSTARSSTRCAPCARSAGLFDLGAHGARPRRRAATRVAVPRPRAHELRARRSRSARSATRSSAARTATPIDDLLVYRERATSVYARRQRLEHRGRPRLDARARARASTSTIDDQTERDWRCSRSRGRARRRCSQRLTRGPRPRAARLLQVRLRHASAASADVRVSRTGYTGEDGFELYLPAREAPRVWNELLDGRRRARPARRSASARATCCASRPGMPLYGHEIDASTTRSRPASSSASRSSRRRATGSGARRWSAIAGRTAAPAGRHHHRRARASRARATTLFAGDERGRPGRAPARRLADARHQHRARPTWPLGHDVRRPASELDFKGKRQPRRAASSRSSPAPASDHDPEPTRTPCAPTTASTPRPTSGSSPTATRC